MTSIDMVKNRLIDKILVTQNRDLLEAVDKLLTFTNNDDIVTLSSQQIEMLMMSEQDIMDGNLITETDLKKLDIQ
jgi:hypothetical protein